jgi:hypothetical protein
MEAKMKTLAAILALAVMAANAFAVLDSDPDQIGFYFDPGANTVNRETPVDDTFWVYLILTNPTEPTLTDYKMAYQLEYPEGMEDQIFRISLHHPPGGIVVGPDELGVLSGDGWVAFNPSLPTTPATILQTWTCFVIGQIPVEWYIQPTTLRGDGQPVYYSAGDPVPMYPVSGSFGDPVARANGEAVVATEMATFGLVKALYR